MRVVAGRFRGRPLAAPDDVGIRPTSDRVRESVFNILAHGLGEFSIAGRRVIDLFAGTGALGIEALSRGASYCLFVEEAADARALIRTQRRSLRPDRRNAHLPSRRDRSRSSRKCRALWPRVPRSALRQGAWRKGPRGLGYGQLADTRRDRHFRRKGRRDQSPFRPSSARSIREPGAKPKCASCALHPWFTKNASEFRILT